MLGITIGALNVYFADLEKYNKLDNKGTVNLVHTRLIEEEFRFLWLHHKLTK